VFNARAFDLAEPFENRRLEGRGRNSGGGDEPTKSSDERATMLPRRVSAAAFNSVD
jgi:hypothetical protein